MTIEDLKSDKWAKLIKQLALEQGWLACGISKAEELTEDARRLDTWLNQGMHGEMGYMERHFDLRVDPRKLVPGAKSVVSLLYNYSPPESLAQENDAPKVAKYAWGSDYHYVLKPKLKTLMALLQAEVGAVEGRVFVDSAPVLERAWAAKSGLGWIGKNGNLLTKQVGSFYFLAELIIDLNLTPDGPTTDHCGRCTACIDACPTEAIVAPTAIDSRKCISYLTIELKEALPTEWLGKMDGWAFGCDVCQDVCPWNRFSKPHSEPAFGPNTELLGMNNRDWVEMTAEVFGKVFKGSAVKRAGLDKLKTHFTHLSI